MARANAERPGSSIGLAHAHRRTRQCDPSIEIVGGALGAPCRGAGRLTAPCRAFRASRSRRRRHPSMWVAMVPAGRCQAAPGLHTAPLRLAHASLGPPAPLPPSPTQKQKELEEEKKRVRLQRCSWVGYGCRQAAAAAAPRALPAPHRLTPHLHRGIYTIGSATMLRPPRFTRSSSRNSAVMAMAAGAAAAAPRPSLPPSSAAAPCGRASPRLRRQGPRLQAGASLAGVTCHLSCRPAWRQQ